MWAAVKYAWEQYLADAGLEVSHCPIAGIF